MNDVIKINVYSHLNWLDAIPLNHLNESLDNFLHFFWDVWNLSITVPKENREEEREWTLPEMTLAKESPIPILA